MASTLKVNTIQGASNTATTLKTNGGTDAITINTSGNVGIGAADISSFGGVYRGLDVAYKGSGLAGRTNNPTFDMRSNLYYDGSNYKYGEGSTSAGILSVGGNQLLFSNAPNGTAGATATVTERMRLNSDNHLLIGTTSTTPNPGISLQNVGSIGIGNNNGNSGHSFLEFRRNATQIGGVTQSGTTGVSYGTSSDYRLKENVKTDWDATTRLEQLKPSRFNFIADADKTVDGFLAHEVSSIVPEAITGDKDATETYTDDDGKEQTRPVYQSIDQSKLVPLLVKALQEALARIKALESK